MTVTADGVVAGGPAARVSGRGPARAAAVEHLSRADRVARGKDARAVAPLESHAEFTPGPGAGSGRAAAEPGGVAGAGAGAGPARADAGVPVHLLPGRGAADGGGPGQHARVGAAGAAVRGRPPVQFRRVRLAGAATWSSTSTTSTRPCPARSSGTSSGWPRAWPWPHGTTGSPPRPGARSPWRRPNATAPRCASSRSRPSWTSGTRTWTSSRSSPSSGPRSRRKGSRKPRSCWPRPTPPTARRRWPS